MGRLLAAGVALAACTADPPEPRFFRDPSAKRAAGQAKAADREPAPAPPPAPAQRTMRPQAPSSPDTLDCTLYDDKAPLTVANFVGLARGTRPFWDANAGAWVKRPLYDGTTFHRVIPDFMIQGGDHLGTGAGDVGYNLQDEIWPGTSHDRPGLLCMANRGPNTNGGQFFITDAAAPHLTAMRTYTIFGECTPLDVIHKIARAPKNRPGSERPEPPVVINKVSIGRR